MIHNVSLDSAPEKGENDFFLETSSYPARFIKIYTDVQKISGNWDLVLGYLDYFGSILYYFSNCSTKIRKYNFLISLHIALLLSYF